MSDVPEIIEEDLLIIEKTPFGQWYFKLLEFMIFLKFLYCDKKLNKLSLIFKKIFVIKIFIRNTYDLQAFSRLDSNCSF